MDGPEDSLNSAHQNSASGMLSRSCRDCSDPFQGFFDSFMVSGHFLTIRCTIQSLASWTMEVPGLKPQPEYMKVGATDPSRPQCTILS